MDTNEILCAMDFGEFTNTVTILNYGVELLVTIRQSTYVNSKTQSFSILIFICSLGRTHKMRKLHRNFNNNNNNILKDEA